MKKTLFVLALIASASFAYSQGTVNFNNTATTPFQTPPTVAANGHADRFVYNTDNTTLLVGTNYLAQLFFAAGANQAESAILTSVNEAPSRFRVATTGSPGTWSGGTRTFSGVPAGSGTVTLQVRVWDGSLFGSYAAAVAGNGITGKSVAFNYNVPAVGSLPTAFVMEGLQSFTLVPEPSTYALAGLAAGAVWMIRRRRNS